MKHHRSTIVRIGLAALAAAAFGCSREEAAPNADGADDTQAQSAAATADASAAEAGSTVDQGAQTANLEGDGSQWLLRGGGYFEQGFSPLTQITKDNVGELGLAWIGDMESTRGLEATPIVVDGVIYVTSTWSRVMAFDAVSGEKLWTYDPQVPRGIGRMLCCDAVNRGVAVHDGNVFFGTLDGRLVSLNAETGKPAWIVNTIEDADYPYTLTGAPRVVNGRVVIGNSGADRGVRGYVTAYDAKTGEQDWRFWVVPEGPDAIPENEDVAAALETWPDDPIWKGKGGGTAWDAMAFDPELNLLYIGTGNGGSWKRQRPDDKTDNLYVSSIVAVDADTGKLAWHYQTTPGDLWDYTATNSIILADMEVDGEMREVLFQAPKNGFFYLLDRKTGELLGADKYGLANWASHVDMTTGRPVLTPQANFFEEDQLIYPNPNGAHDWQSMSFNPQTGLAYIPALDVPWVFSTKPGFRYFYDLGVPARHLERMTEDQPAVDEAEKGGFLKAWDVAGRELKWKVPLATTWNSGTLTTATNLLFHASGDGYFSAYDAETGERLLHLFTGNSAIAAPVTYQIDGVQYVALLAGYGGSGMITVGDDAALKTYENTGRLIVFKLGGGDVPTPAKRETPLGPAPQNASLPPMGEDNLAAASKLYLNCAGCHSTGGGTPMLPNLARVPDLGEETFRSILLEGALVPRGMPNFGEELTQEDVDLLYEYISRGRHNVPVENVRWY